LLVAMTILGIALGLVASASANQQRLFADLSDDAALDAQVREAAAALPVELRSASSSGGDIREARDTSLEIRGTIASAVVCDTTKGALVFAPAIGGAGTRASILSAPVVGDTAWLWSPVEGTPWHPYVISKVGSVAGAACAPAGPTLAAAELGVSRVTITVTPSPVSPIGVPVRVTRPLRYSLYRASDGLWYLGEKDWNTASAKFNTIQPVAGPFLTASQGGLAFSYRDSGGGVLATPVAGTAAIALVRMDIRGQTQAAMRELKLANASIRRRDSANVAVLLRNRR
jgi:hypothetical protein